MVNDYNQHLHTVLFQALGVDMDYLLKKSEYAFLIPLQEITSTMKHLTSSFQEASLVYHKFPLSLETANVHAEQFHLIFTIFKQVILKEVPATSTAKFSKEELLPWGYNPNLEIDYDALWEDF